MYFIKNTILKQIKDTIGKAPIESGGILGLKDNVICAYYFDKGDFCKIDEYRPNIKKLNSVINEWGNKGISFIGIIHSHPNSYKIPSLQDCNYVDVLMKQNRFLEKIILPIVIIENDDVQIYYYEYLQQVKDFSSIDVLIME